MDISLEDISGLDVLIKIKAIEKAHGKTAEDQVVVIMVTAHSEKEIVVECIKAGCKAYFIKPLKQEFIDKKLADLGYTPAL